MIFSFFIFCFVHVYDPQKRQRKTGRAERAGVAFALGWI